MLKPFFLSITAAIFCIASLCIAYFYMEQYLLLEACPLCILDRFTVGFMSIGFFGYAFATKFSKPLLQKISWAFTSFTLLIGFILTGRHIWLQAQPPNDSGFCLTSSESVQNVLALIGKAFDANADCGGIAWVFLGLSIPQQLLVFFIFITILQLCLYKGMIKK